MKRIENFGAQGDFLIMRIDNIPDNLVPFNPEDGKYVIAHSETGHNHVMDIDGVKAYKAADISDDRLFELFLSVDRTAEIEHLRSFDTHETLQIPPGNFVVKRQRQHTAEGFRKVQD